MLMWFGSSVLREIFFVLVLSMIISTISINIVLINHMFISWKTNISYSFPLF